MATTDGCPECNFPPGGHAQVCPVPMLNRIRAMIAEMQPTIVPCKACGQTGHVWLVSKDSPYGAWRACDGCHGAGVHLLAAVDDGPCAKLGHAWLWTGKPGNDRYCQRCGVRCYDALT